MKTPQDHLKALSDAPETVTFETSKGKLELPHISKIPSRAFRLARKGNDQLDQFFILIESTFPEGSKELAIIDSLNTVELGEIFLQWTQGADLGESSSSES